ncbi:MAG: hypothetical protein V7L25_01730 [Nostoc sp.]|uniref:hypothetical protein n=1 Tax=Nostoc sp. TaxID=1180 RepID=UPI002FF0CD63
MSRNRVWLPEIGLGIGRERGIYQGIVREWLYYYDEKGQKLLTPEERAAFEEQRRVEAKQQVKMLAEKLKALGVEPETLL